MTDDEAKASPAPLPMKIEIESKGTITVAVEQVTVVGDRRPINETTVDQLMESIKSSRRLFNPIIVRKAQDGGEGLLLVAGLHRLEAMKRLGSATIQCTVLERDDDLSAELAEIDENLIRNNPSPAEHARLTQRRAEIIKVLAAQDGTASEAKASKQALRRAGHLTGPDGASTRDQARRTGQTKDKVQRSQKRGGILGSLIDRVVGTSLDKGVELDALTKLPEPEREALVNRAADGEAVSARTADRKPKPKTKRPVKLTRRERAHKEFHAWHLEYDDLEELAQVQRQIMDIEDALSKTDIRPREDVPPPSSSSTIAEEEGGV